MHPILFTLGPFKLYTYGLCIALGFMSGIALSAYRAYRRRVSVDLIFDMAIWVVISAILGGRLLYVLIEWRYFWEQPLRIFKLWEGGLVFYGGMIATFAAMAYYFRRNNLDFWFMTDLIVISLPLGQVFGRVGCVFNGCCYGAETTSSWGVVFPNLADGIHRHPTQLYEAVGALAIVGLLLWIDQVKAYEGQVIAADMVLYGLLRFTVEIWRDDPRGAFGPFSTSQWLSLLVAALGVAAMFAARRVRHLGPTPGRVPLDPPDGPDAAGPPAAPAGARA